MNQFNQNLKPKHVTGDKGRKACISHDFDFTPEWLKKQPPCPYWYIN